MARSLGQATELRAVNSTQQYQSAGVMGTHLEQVFVLQFRLVMRVAQHHDIACLSQRHLSGCGDGSHGRVTQVGRQDSD
ncbi:MAG: hypothetical protein EBT05_00295 [Betaproteobacteria bacterium]|nr:hypothetical protein [Betaproteobacteria bacterium]